MRPLPLLARSRRTLAVAMALLLVAACGDAPRTVHIGSDNCDHCHMTISQEAFAAQLITDRGRAYLFDSVECMAEFLNEGETVTRDQVRSLWVTDFAEPGSWVRAEDARYLRSDELRSPMGMGLSAYATDEGAGESRSEFGGELMDWEQVLRLVEENPVRGMGRSHAH